MYLSTFGSTYYLYLSSFADEYLILILKYFSNYLSAVERQVLWQVFSCCSLRFRCHREREGRSPFRLSLLQFLPPSGVSLSLVLPWHQSGKFHVASLVRVGVTEPAFFLMTTRCRGQAKQTGKYSFKRVGQRIRQSGTPCFSPRAISRQCWRH
jgi:hypothetical protein